MSDDDARHSEPAGLSPDLGVDGPTLARYVAGECSPSEVARITAWLATSPSGRELVSALKAVWRSTADATHPPSNDSVAAWEQLRPMLDTSDRGAAARVRGPLRIEAPASRARPWRSIALGMAATVVAVVVWRTTSHSTPGPRAQEFATPAGGRATVTLRDGTQLTLGPATRLRVPANFGKGIRTVDLDGEAVFAVAHDPVRPFVVRTASAVVRDVGTRFGVRAYAEDSTARIVVADGAVAVSAVGGATLGSATLVRGDLMTIDATGKALLAHHVAIDDELAWASGRILLRGVTLAQAGRELARTYSIDVQVPDAALASQRVTATFDRERDGLNDVLAFLALALNARVERHGTAVTFVPGPLVIPEPR